MKKPMTSMTTASITRSKIRRRLATKRSNALEDSGSTCVTAYSRPALRGARIGLIESIGNRLGGAQRCPVSLHSGVGLEHADDPEPRVDNAQAGDDKTHQQAEQIAFETGPARPGEPAHFGGGGGLAAEQVH